MTPSTRPLGLLLCLTAGQALAACDHPSASPASPPPAAGLPRTSPEAQGVDSARLARLLEHAMAGDLALHSLTVVRHRAVVLDAVFFPYDGQRPHDVASCTKSLTSLALGLALADGSIASVDSPLVSFFPGRAVANLDDRKGAMTLRDALTMRSGLQCVAQPTEATLLAMQASPDWIGYALDLPMEAPPGERWIYCSPASHLLSGVVSAATGKPLDQLLRERVFAPLGVGEVVWPRDPQGVSHGHGDARLVPGDLARVGQLLLDHGRWGDAQLVEAGWIDASTSDQVGSGGPPGGYGLHWWTRPDGAFHANGRGGQFLLVVPALDLVVVTTGAASPDQEARYGELLAADLLPAIVSEGALADNAAAQGELQGLVARAASPPGASPPEPAPPPAQAASGKDFQADDNPLGWRSFRVELADAEATLTIRFSGAEARVRVGLDGVPRISRRSPLSADPRHDDADVAAAGRFVGDRTLEITFDTIDRIDAGTIALSFDGASATVDLYEKTFLHGHITFAAASHD